MYHEETIRQIQIEGHCAIQLAWVLQKYQCHEGQKQTEEVSRLKNTKETWPLHVICEILDWILDI